MKDLRQAEASTTAVHQYFGYDEDWVTIPLRDMTDSYWHLTGPTGTVYYADSEDELETGVGNYYSAVVYTQRFLPKWVYETDDYTMICADTQCDGNKFLMIFDNAKKRTECHR